jgi:hypothetical protein
MKLKSLLKESKVWERKFGEPLPTIEDTAKRFKMKQEQEINERPDQDTAKVSKILGKSINDVHKFVMKHGLDADDLLDVIEAGDRRRSSLMIIAAMNGRSKALRQLDDLLGFL